MSDDTTKRPEDAPGFENSEPTLRVPSGGAPEVAEPPQENLSEPPAIVGSPLTKTLSTAFYEEEETETKLYKVPILNATFTLMSLTLLLLTVWAVWQDYDREWKRYNYEWQDFQAQQLDAEITARKKAIQDELAKLLAEIDQTEKRLDNPSMRLHRTRVNQAKSDAKIADTEAKFWKSDLDANKFVHEKKIEKIIHDHGRETPEAAKKIEALEKSFHAERIEPYEKLQAAAQIATTRANEEEKGLQERLEKFRALEKSRDDKLRDVLLLEANLSAVDASAKNTIRNWPLLDFFSPSAKIEKAVLNDLTEPLNFLDVPRVDRCKSCHLNIDSPLMAHADVKGMEDRPHEGKVFEAHPRLDLFVGSASPHPYLEFGCTICHYGDPRALSFTTASHTPSDDHEKHEWEKKYHWHKMHHQDYPMLPLEYVHATCSKCHTEESRIQGADNWNEGRELVERYGCYGCHKLKGFEDYDKVGPNLSRIMSKVKPNFLYKWIHDPTEFRPSTLMPQFFGLINNQDSIEVIGEGGESHVHNFAVRNEVEALAIAHYLEKTSGELDDLWQLPENLKGDATRGQQVFTESGCAGCHSIASLGIAANDYAPDLGGVGSKLNEDWLYDWVIQPSHYDPNSPMPKLRLEEDENGNQKVADLVTFLMSLRNESFEQAASKTITSDADRQILRDLAYTDLRQKMTRREADALIAAAYATPPAGEAGEGGEGDAKKATPALAPGGGDDTLLMYVGERTISRYGCFGCHEGIQGFEGAQPIGAELSKHGNKGVDRLDYGHWGHQPNEEYAVPKTRIGWFTKKLENTRIFDMLPTRTTDKDGHASYEPTSTRMAKAPEDLLKMPLFSFHDDPEKVKAVVTFLISNVVDPIPLQKRHRLDPKEKVIEKGTRITRDFNCKGCHRIGAELQEHNVAELPKFSFDDPDSAAERNEVEKETWLADEVVLEAIPEKNLDAITLQKGTFLSQTFKWTGARGPDDEYSVIEILNHYWETKGVPQRDRIVSLFGYDEGRVRTLFGNTAEDRPKAPPLLRLQGQRVHGDWLFNFLLNIEPLRPWLSIRMPSYNMTEEESSAIVDMFRSLSDVDDVYERFASHELDMATAQFGKSRFISAAEGGLGCNSCHPAGDQMPSTDDKNSWGPNLALARERLRPEWIYSWLISPNSFMTGTKMPAFWIQADPFEEQEVFSPEDRAFIDSHVPFLKGVGLIESAPDFRKDTDGLMQYLMHMDKIEE